MRRPKGYLKSHWIWLILLANLVLSHPAAVLGTSLVYKNFIVRYDRGWDILCEPYVVKKNDWVLKIFRQKGEIAHQDFREFLGIFKRLNPHIKDVDMIRPGQGIDIPLRKLEHGSLPGQDIGVITIPFVSLTKVTDIVKEHSDRYTVQKGDTVSKLIARKYGRYGTKSYHEGVQLFKAANPRITDLNRIYAGQKVYLPDPEIREKSWYAAIYDDQGKLRESVDQGKVSKTSQEKPAPIPKTPGTAPAPKPAPRKGHLAEAAAFAGGRLQAKGTYYLPRVGAEDFELDLSKHPVLEFDKGAKLVFTSGNNIMDMDNDAFFSNWPDMKPVSIDARSSTEQYVSAIFQSLEEKEQVVDEISFRHQGVHVAVRAKWVRTEGNGRSLCITPIEAPEQQTPESIKRYLDQNGIVIKEILPAGTALGEDRENKQRHTIKNILAIAPTRPQDFVQTLAMALEFIYVPNAEITFPYAGIQVQAFANVLSTKTGQEILVDFGELYGDAVTAIGKTGLNVVQISVQESYEAITLKIFSALGVNFERHPTLFAAQRSGQYNTAITIDGLLYANDANRRILLTGADLHSAVTDLLSDRGIDMVVW